MQAQASKSGSAGDLQGLPAAGSEGREGATRAAAGIQETGIKPIAPLHSGAPVLADVDLYEEPIAHAMRLLAETYDVSIATGALPDTKVTIRLRSIGAQDAFAAVAAAAG